MQNKAVLTAQVNVPVLLQPDCWDDYVGGGLVEGDVENAADFSTLVTNHPLFVFAACGHDICPQHGRQLPSFIPLKV